jgi:hypothetical protein
MISDGLVGGIFLAGVKKGCGDLDDQVVTAARPGLYNVILTVIHPLIPSVGGDFLVYFPNVEDRSKG